MHDLLAELDGYRTELANAERAGRQDRADAVRPHLGRLAGLIEAEAARLDAQAETHENEGQDVLAAQARVEAKRLRRGAQLTADASPAGENAADARPKETATTKRKGGN